MTNPIREAAKSDVNGIRFRAAHPWLRLISVMAINVALFVLSAFTAFGLRFDFSLSQTEVNQILFALPVWIVLKSSVFVLFGLHRSAWRFISAPDALRLLAANVLSSFISTPAIAVFGPSGFPRSIYLLDLAITLLLTSGVRLAGRLLLESHVHNNRQDSQRTFVYGAGAAGVMLVREIRSNPGMGYTACGFIDDDPRKTGLLIQGVPVLGTGEDLPRLAAKHNVTSVLIAMPSASAQDLLKVLSTCTSAQLRFRTLPSISEVVHRSNGRAQVRDVALEDLLGRTPVRLDEDCVRAKLGNQVVLVTGAAGSIGSELCRQITRFKPALIIGFDIAETAIFNIDREMRQSFPDVPFYPIIGNVQNATALDRVFAEHHPAIVFHAAAYKHVPLMESHVFEAIQNNVLGTFTVAQAAQAGGALDFVMISTDKAVRPTSIMGLTKRISEILLCSMPPSNTRISSVRFGNVLGSAGSAVPIFREQIAAGKSVTITHPDMRRYFMTIPEAVQLVLQASTMGQGGEIFVLDMGEPVRIVDLARNLILLSGLRPDEDIKIEFTGIRPGEKLYEEVNGTDEQTRPTYHEKVRIFAVNDTRIPDIHSWVADVRTLCASRDLRALLLFKDLVTDYTPSTQIMHRLFDQATPQRSTPARRYQVKEHAASVQS